MTKYRIIFFVLCSSFLLYGQSDLRIEPLNWWVDMSNPEVQLMIEAPDVGERRALFVDEDVRVIRSTPGESKNYLFVDVDLSKATAGQKTLMLRSDRDTIYTTYELKSRLKRGNEYPGFDASDVIYLITPDRFANGDTTNDNVSSLRERFINRQDDYGRHGGDIRGMINHLDYISDMGFTAIWTNPMLTNDMIQSSYHGYAITDYYQVDPRFGSLEEYKELCDKARQRGMKVIMDVVSNHCGRNHRWMSDLPFRDWVGYSGIYVNTNHRRTVNQDPYASQRDKDLMVQGWFVEAMPDLNQKNPYLARYIIQNSIWWIETLGLGGIRQDTYPYSDKYFMAQWASEIMTEYPEFSIVGEEWSFNPLLVGYWQDSERNPDGYRSYLRSTMDFPMQKAIVEGIREEESWDKGLVKIYEGMANDLFYPSPEDIMLFGDNHDMTRIYTALDEDEDKTKMAMGLVLTLPRIAQVYYGTEILMSDAAKPGDHGLIRSEFPGGWSDSEANAFTGLGLTYEQQDMQKFIKKLLHLRRDHLAFQYGKMLHFAPEDGIYVYFRYTDRETFMMVINKNPSGKTLYLERFQEVLRGKTKATEVFSGVTMLADSQLFIPQNSFQIYQIE